MADRYSIRLHFYGTFLGLMLCLRPLRLAEVLGPTPMPEEQRDQFVETSIEWLLTHVQEIREAFAAPVPNLDGDAPET